MKSNTLNWLSKRKARRIKTDRPDGRQWCIHTGNGWLWNIFLCLLVCVCVLFCFFGKYALGCYYYDIHQRASRRQDGVWGSNTKYGQKMNPNCLFIYYYYYFLYRFFSSLNNFFHHLANNTIIGAVTYVMCVIATLASFIFVCCFIFIFIFTLSLSLRSTSSILLFLHTFICLVVIHS